MISQPVVPVSDRPSLRLYDPPAAPANPAPTSTSSPERPSPEWTLSRFVADWFIPRIRFRPAAKYRRLAVEKTVSLDRNMIAYWRRHTSDPPMRAIDDDVIEDFAERLATSPALRRETPPSHNTQARILRHLKTVLTEAGPASQRHPRARGLFRSRKRWPLGMPYVQVPAATPSTHNYFDAAARERIWIACQAGPDCEDFGGVPGAVVWRLLFAVTYNVGLRIDSIMHAEWSWIGDQSVYRDCPGDFLVVPAISYKKGQKRPPFYLNAAARSELAAMKAAQQAAGLGEYTRIVPWFSTPRARSDVAAENQARLWPLGRGTLFRLFKRILAAAEVSGAGHVDFTGLRAALATWCQMTNPGLAPIVMGHKAGQVTTDHYTHYTAVRDLLARVPQPGQLVQRALF